MVQGVSAAGCQSAAMMPGAQAMGAAAGLQSAPAMSGMQMQANAGVSMQSGVSMQDIFRAALMQLLLKDDKKEEQDPLMSLLMMGMMLQGGGGSVSMYCSSEISTAYGAGGPTAATGATFSAQV